MTDTPLTQSADPGPHRTATPDVPEPTRRGRPTPLRRLLPVAAAVSTVPYLALKIAWIAGSGVGLADPAAMHTPSMIAANVLTAGLDAVVVLLVLALTSGWGRRLPAAVVLLPAWVGTGLLVPIAVAFLPVTVVAGAAGLATGDGSMAWWVGPIVYGGFTAQAVVLLVAFVLHTRERWNLPCRRVVLADPAPAAPGHATAPHPGAPQSTPPHAARLRGARRSSTTSWVALHRGLLGLGAAFALVSAALHLAAGIAGSWTTLLTEGTDAVLALLAVVGVVAVGRGGRGRALVAAWVGTGAMLGWGLYTCLLVLADTPFTPGPVTSLAALAAVLGAQPLAVAVLLSLSTGR
jgi:hypothetical protein